VTGYREAIVAVYLGIDIGTSAVKAVLAGDLAGPQTETPLAAAEVPLATSRPHPGWSEQHPDLWWDAVRAALGRLRAAAPAAYAATAAIGLSGQMHGAVVLGADDRPLRPAILWNDGRAAAEARELNAALPDLGRIAGVPAMAGFLAPKIAWLRRHEPDVFAAIRHVLLPKDWVRLCLTGERVTDMCDAAGAILLDEAARRWYGPAVAAVGLDEAQLPRLAEGPEISGRLTAKVAAELGLPVDTPVVTGAGDAAAAGIGIGMVEPGDAFLSLGTSSQVFVTTDFHRPYPETLIHAFAHALPGRWFQMAAMLNGASCIAWVARALGEADIGGLIDRIAARGRPVSPVTFLPYLQGERTPHDDPNARGVFFGMDGGSDGLDLAQAVLEGVAFTLADAMTALEGAGSRPEALSAVGGGSRGTHFMRIVASAIGLPIARREGGERGPAFGVARLARLAVTGESVADVCGKPRIIDVVEPDPTLREALLGRLPLYRDLYRDLKPLFARAAG
jgi:xylulokinase